MRNPLLKIIALVLITLTVSAAERFEPHTLPIGSAAPDFALPGVDGKTHHLADYSSAKILVIIFTCNHCPTANAYEKRIMQLDADYKSKSVQVVAINPNDAKAIRLDELGYTDVSDDLESMKIRAKQRGFAFPYLYDGDTQSVAKAYGCQATPHVFIFDQDRKLRYTGRIDDGERKPVKHDDARNAINALLAGTTVPVEKTKVFGCSTKWAYKQDDVGAFNAKCDAEPVSLKEIDLTGIDKIAKNNSDKLLVVNFWATWCGPCVNELPEFVTMNRMYRKRPFEMITISLDDPEQKAAAEKVLAKNHVSATNYIFTGDRDAMMKAIDPQWEGPVPHTMLIAPGGKVIYRTTQEIEPLEVKGKIVDFLGRTY